MKFKISNCKNIQSGEITIKQGELNIRYGPNGTGKSTISLAIQYMFDPNIIPKLKSFNYLDSTPSVSLLEGELPRGVKVFNEDYIKQHLFIEGRVLDDKRVYEVLIQDRMLEDKKEALLSMVEEIKLICQDNEIATFINKIHSLRRDVPLNDKWNQFNGRGKVYQALKEGNRYIAANIPELLSEYRDLLVGDKRVKWIEWFNSGHFDSVNCPYCREKLKNNFPEIKNTITETYKNANVKNITDFLNNLDHNISDLSSDTKQIIQDKYNHPEGLQTGDENLVNIHGCLYSLVESLEKLRELSEFDLLDAGYTTHLTEDYIKAIQEVDFLENSKLLQQLVDLKTKIEMLQASNTDYLQSKGEFHSALKDKVSKSKKQINDFMEKAGIPYEVDFVGGETKHPKVILKHTGVDVTNILDSLSFGEKNAFALMMFLMDVISEDVDLIILDDPISSFDEHKKFALMHTLFLTSEDKNMKNRTVLMLTHDITPIIDLMYVKDYPNINAKFLRLSEGHLSENPVSKEHIKNVLQVSKDLYLDSARPLLSRLIEYRRYLELTGSNDYYKYDLISSLLKLKSTPQIKIGNANFNNFSQEQIDLASRAIQIEMKLEQFDYGAVVAKLSDKQILIETFDQSTDYEKINIMRILSIVVKDKFDNEVLKKFIFESYHIENTMTFQLDPQAFNTIPFYIIAACNRFVDKHR